MFPSSPFISSLASSVLYFLYFSSIRQNCPFWFFLCRISSISFISFASSLPSTLFLGLFHVFHSLFLVLFHLFLFFSRHPSFTSISDPSFPNPPTSFPCLPFYSPLPSFLPRLSPFRPCPFLLILLLLLRLLFPLPSLQPTTAIPPPPSPILLHLPLPPSTLFSYMSSSNPFFSSTSFLSFFTEFASLLQFL